MLRLSLPWSLVPLATAFAAGACSPASPEAAILGSGSDAGRATADSSAPSSGAADASSSTSASSQSVSADGSGSPPGDSSESGSPADNDGNAAALEAGSDTGATNDVDATNATDASNADNDATSGTDATSAPDGPSADGIAPPAYLVCSPSFTWMNIAEVTSIATAGFGRFGGVSSNELTVAWTSPSGAVLVADRTSTAAPFGDPFQVDIGGASIPGGRVGLSPTGLQIVVALPNANGATLLGGFVRTSVGGAWSAESSSEFKYVNATNSETGGSFSEPVVRADGLSIFYLAVTGSNEPVLNESTWNTAEKAWNTGYPISGPEFAIASGSQTRRPTGTSGDGLTLFFFDEVAGNERAAWRESASPMSEFTLFVDLPDFPEAAPGGSCHTLYFQGSDPEAGTPALFTGQ